MTDFNFWFLVSALSLLNLIVLGWLVIMVLRSQRELRRDWAALEADAAAAAARRAQARQALKDSEQAGQPGSELRSDDHDEQN